MIVNQTLRATMASIPSPTSASRIAAHNMAAEGDVGSPNAQPVNTIGMFQNSTPEDKLHMMIESLRTRLCEEVCVHHS